MARERDAYMFLKGIACGSRDTDSRDQANGEADW